MEEQVHKLLDDLQSSNNAVRKSGEAQLNHLYASKGLPIALLSIAKHGGVSLVVKQAALFSLKDFVNKTWAVDLEGFEPQYANVLDEPTRQQIREQILQLAVFSKEDGKVRTAASLTVSKIANHDYPEEWPTLLNIILAALATEDDSQLHGALKVLSDLMDDGLSDEQFQEPAPRIFRDLRNIVGDESRPGFRRALAIQIFNASIDFLEQMQIDHGASVLTFAQGALEQWLPLFARILETPLPEDPSLEGPAKSDRDGLIAMKVQIYKTLAKLRQLLAVLVIPHSPGLFEVTWKSLLATQSLYSNLFIEDDQPSRQETNDHLPFSLDYLVLDQIDFLGSILRDQEPFIRLKQAAKATPVADVLSEDLLWLRQQITAVVHYAQISKYEEQSFTDDINLWLADEASVTADYTARSTSGDLASKLTSHLREIALDQLLQIAAEIPEANANSWRLSEAGLFVAGNMFSAFAEMSRKIPESIATSPAMRVLEQKLRTIKAGSNNSEFLIARALLCSGKLSLAIQLQQLDDFEVCVKAIQGNLGNNEIIRAAAIVAVQSYAKALSQSSIKSSNLIPVIISAINDFVSSQDPEELAEGEDLLMAIVYTIQAIVMLQPDVVLTPEAPALDIIFTLASRASSSLQFTSLVDETFEDVAKAIASEPQQYVRLCEKVLPSLTGAFGAADAIEDEHLAILAAQLLASLTEHCPNLPAGYVNTVMPKILRVLMRSEEGELVRPLTESIKLMIQHDPVQFFAWTNEEGKGGLEVCLLVIDRLLGSEMDEYAAGEVGGLAGALVEKAGAEQLGTFLPAILKALVFRAASTERPGFIQDLMMVFARLTNVSAKEVVDFLGDTQIGDQTALAVILNKWLEYTSNFAGFDEIRQNAMAISKIFALGDPRLDTILVKGDLVPDTSNRIKTRSRSKKNPDQFTQIPATLKIVKLLIAEFAFSAGNATRSAAPGPEDHSQHSALLNGNDAASRQELINDEMIDELIDDDDDDDWEDDDTYGLGSSAMGFDLGSSTKEALMAFADAGENYGQRRGPDAETRGYLIEFFKAAGQGQFRHWDQITAALKPEEKEILAAAQTMNQEAAA